MDVDGVGDLVIGCIIAFGGVYGRRLEARIRIGVNGSHR